MITGAEKLAKENTDAGWYAFSIVLEAKMATLVQMVESKQPDVTKDQFMGMCERYWDKYCIANRGKKK